MARARRIFQWMRCAFGMICLLAYLSAAAGILPELCALAASFDRSHKALVGICDGARVLVLSHGPSLTAESHQHGLIAQFLCVLAKQDGALRDHRIEFAACGVSDRSHSKVRLSAPKTLAQLNVSCRLDINPIVAGIGGSLPERASPETTIAIFSIRSTVLLI